MMKREEEIRSDEPTDQTMLGTVEREAVHLNFENEYSPTPLTVRLRRCVLSCARLMGSMHGPRESTEQKNCFGRFGCIHMCAYHLMNATLVGACV